MAFPILTTIEVIVSILLLGLHGLRLALQVLTSNICLFFLFFINFVDTDSLSAVAILDLKAMICWMKNIFAVLRCYVYILYHPLSTSF